MTAGETTDHDEAERAGQRQAHEGRLGQRLVGLLDLLGRHADAVVSDRDDVAVGLGAVAHDLHPGLGRREVGGVLHQLRQQVGEVGRHVGGDEDLVEAEQVDPPEVLDLGEGGPHHVGEGSRTATAAGRLGPGEHQQRLGVAAHAGGQVVESIQVLELVGILLATLQLVDEVDLAVEQRLVAASQVDEHLADALAEQGGLLRGHLAGHPLHVVEGVGQPADLVVGLDLDRDEGPHLEGHLVLGGVPQPLHQAGHLLGGEPVGGLGEVVERAGDAPGQEHGGQQGDQQGRDAAEHEAVGRRLGRAAGGVGPGDHVGVEVDLDVVEVLELAGGGLDGLSGVELERGLVDRPVDEPHEVPVDAPTDVVEGDAGF